MAEFVPTIPCFQNTAYESDRRPIGSSRQWQPNELRGSGCRKVRAGGTFGIRNSLPLQDLGSLLSCLKFGVFDRFNPASPRYRYHPQKRRLCRGKPP